MKARASLFAAALTLAPHSALPDEIVPYFEPTPELVQEVKACVETAKGYSRQIQKVAAALPACFRLTERLCHDHYRPTSGGIFHYEAGVCIEAERLVWATLVKQETERLTEWFDELDEGGEKRYRSEIFQKSQTDWVEYIEVDCLSHAYAGGGGTGEQYAQGECLAAQYAQRYLLLLSR